MYLPRLKKKKVKGSKEIKTNAFQYCYTDETLDGKKKWVKKKEEQFHSQKALSGPDAP